MSGSPARLRRLHERWVFDRLRRGGSASRAELAKETGLSAPTVGKVVDALLAEGLVEEVRTAESSTRETGASGRPARPVTLCRSRSSVIALQLGVRHTRLAALPLAGPLDDRWPVRFRTPKGVRAWIKRLRSAATELGLASPKAVMVSVPGVVDEQAGRVLLSPNLHWSQGVDLRELAGEFWHGPVHIVQEIQALALGHLEAETGHEDFLLVDIGEGVGGAAVVRGRLYSGSLAIRGELGHTPVPGNPRLCGCGGVGCLETLISRAGLLEGWREAHGKSQDGISASAAWKAMKDCLAQGRREPWLDMRLEAAGAVIAGALNVLGLQRVVVTGVATELPGVFVERLAKWIERSAMWARFGQIRCEAAPRRRAMGLISAAIDRIILPPQTWEAGEEATDEPRVVRHEVRRGGKDMQDIKDMQDPRLRSSPVFRLARGMKESGQFGAGPVVVSRAPGRLDVMGGIADYSGSLVCEMPLSLATAAAGQARTDGQFVCQSGRRGKSVSVAMKSLSKGDPKAAVASLKGDDHWAKYVAGCAWWLINHGETYASGRTDTRGLRPGLEEGEAIKRAMRGATVFLESDLPLGGGVSSSAAIEVATMTALAEVWGFEVPGMALAAACQVVENRVVGAPCGVMDQVTSCLGEEGALLKLLCQPGADGLPAQVQGVIKVPEGFGFVGVHSGVRHEVSGDPYTDTRVAAFMGQKILSVLERLDVTDGWLARVGPKRYCTELRQKLPVQMTGQAFLDQYEATNDTVTRVDPRKRYHVRAATSHHVLESRRVRRFAALLEKAEEGCKADCLEARMRKAGRLMLASHWSYGLRAGMGHEGTDKLVRLAMELGPERGFYGAKITGGGCGGTVAMLISRRLGVREKLRTLCERYTRETGRETMLFDRSGPGAAKWGVARMKWEDWA